jgi:hypothetical protein
MWRRFFKKERRFVEVSGPSDQKRILSHEEYIAETLNENRVRAELARHGISLPQKPDKIIEHIIDRFM